MLSRALALESTGTLTVAGMGVSRVALSSVCFLVRAKMALQTIGRNRGDGWQAGRYADSGGYTRARKGTHTELEGCLYRSRLSEGRSVLSCLPLVLSVVSSGEGKCSAAASAAACHGFWWAAGPAVAIPPAAVRLLLPHGGGAPQLRTAPTAGAAPPVRSAAHQLAGAEPGGVHHACIVHRLLVQRVKQAARLLVEAAAELVHLQAGRAGQDSGGSSRRGSRRGSRTGSRRSSRTVGLAICISTQQCAGPHLRPTTPGGPRQAKRTLKAPMAAEPSGCSTAPVWKRLALRNNRSARGQSQVHATCLGQTFEQQDTRHA